ncbi:MAG: hypothetical protein JW841_14605 [Deltaproteobacteria bacterium]|nr:hypothetical protein [Deltaproteobacteria bacterium]
MATEVNNSSSNLNVTIDPNIVRGYDVRGYIRPVVAGGKERPQNLNPEIAEAFGRAVGSLIEIGGTVAVTSDHRHLSPELVQGLTRGFTRIGINVIHNTNQEIYDGHSFLPTGALSWYLIKSQLQGAIQVTGSHNPPEFNGLKISVGLKALFGEDLQKLIPIINEGRFRADVDKVQRGKVSKVDILGQYMAMLRLAFEQYKHKLHVVMDAGNGIGRVITPILRHAGCEVEEMFAKPISSFPNHLADPSSDEGTHALRERIKTLNTALKTSEQPWIGIALDGDSDRSGFVDEQGDVVWPERMAAIFYADYLDEPANHGHVLALDVRASNVVRDTVIKHGGNGLFITAGYPSHRQFASLEIPELNKTRVEVSAEASGHFFFPTASLDEKGNILEYAKNYLIDDGIYSALRFLKIVDKRGVEKASTVREIMAELPTYATSNELRLYVPDEIKNDLVDTVRQELIKRYSSELATQVPMQVINGLKIQGHTASIVEVDGIRLQFSDGAWLVVRISNTSPNIVVKFEAKTKERLHSLMQVVRELLATKDQVELGPLDQEMENWG